MFAKLTSITSLDLDNLDTSLVEDMSYMFWGDENMGSINLQNFNTKNVKDMSKMFLSCTKLTSLTT